MQQTYFLFKFYEDQGGRKFDNTIVSERIVLVRIIEDTGMILIFLYKFGDILY